MVACQLKTEDGGFTVVIGTSDKDEGEENSQGELPIMVDILGPQEPGKMSLNCLVLYGGSWALQTRRYTSYEGIADGGAPNLIAEKFISQWKPHYDHEIPLGDDRSPWLHPLDKRGTEDYFGLLYVIERRLQQVQSKPEGQGI